MYKNRLTQCRGRRSAAQNYLLSMAVIHSIAILGRLHRDAALLLGAEDSELFPGFLHCSCSHHTIMKVEEFHWGTFVGGETDGAHNLQNWYAKPVLNLSPVYRIKNKTHEAKLRLVMAVERASGGNLGT